MLLLLVGTQVNTSLGDFVTLWLIRGCALDQLEASALCGKTSSPDGKFFLSKVCRFRRLLKVSVRRIDITAQFSN